MPIINKGRTIVRPVYVGDVSNVLAQLLEEERSSGKLLELFGYFFFSNWFVSRPKEYHYLALVNFFCDIAYRNPRLVYLPKPVAKLFGAIIQRIQFTPVATADEVERVMFSIMIIFVLFCFFIF